jgi:hypothetical protein
MEPRVRLKFSDGSEIICNEYKKNCLGLRNDFEIFVSDITPIKLVEDEKIEIYYNYDPFDLKKEKHIVEIKYSANGDSESTNNQDRLPMEIQISQVDEKTISIKTPTGIFPKDANLNFDASTLVKPKKDEMGYSVTAFEFTINTYVGKKVEKNVIRFLNNRNYTSEKLKYLIRYPEYFTLTKEESTADVLESIYFTSTQTNKKMRIIFKPITQCTETMQKYFFASINPDGKKVSRFVRDGKYYFGYHEKGYGVNGEYMPTCDEYWIVDSKDSPTGKIGVIVEMAGIDVSTETSSKLETNELDLILRTLQF